jgi:hypothetical protein
MDYLVAVLLPQLLHGLVFGPRWGCWRWADRDLRTARRHDFAHGELYMLGPTPGSP